MKPRCAIYVPERHYGRPGPCESKRAVRPIPYQGRRILACIGHRNFIAAGGQPQLVEGRR